MNTNSVNITTYLVCLMVVDNVVNSKATEVETIEGYTCTPTTKAYRSEFCYVPQNMEIDKSWSTLLTYQNDDSDAKNYCKIVFKDMIEANIVTYGSIQYVVERFESGVSAGTVSVLDMTYQKVGLTNCFGSKYHAHIQVRKWQGTGNDAVRSFSCELTNGCLNLITSTAVSTVNRVRRGIKRNLRLLWYGCWNCRDSGRLMDAADTTDGFTQYYNLTLNTSFGLVNNEISIGGGNLYSMILTNLDINVSSTWNTTVNFTLQDLSFAEDNTNPINPVSPGTNTTDDPSSAFTPRPQFMYLALILLCLMITTLV